MVMQDQEALFPRTAAAPAGCRVLLVDALQLLARCDARLNSFSLQLGSVVYRPALVWNITSEKSRNLRDSNEVVLLQRKDLKENNALNNLQGSKRSVTWRLRSLEPLDFTVRFLLSRNCVMKTICSSFSFMKKYFIHTSTTQIPSCQVAICCRGW